MQGEFRMVTDIAAVAPKELLFNYDELKAFLSENLEQYRTMVVTEEGISDARADRAKLNKLADSINSYRINVKNQLMAQYDSDFKPKCDELVSMTKEAAENISSQIKAFEQKEKAAKVAELQGFYLSVATEETMVYCPWDKIFNPKWENKGYNTEDAKEEIKAAVFYTESDLKSIRDIGGDDTPYLLDVYKQTRDLNAVVRKSMEIKAAREREEQRKREEEERRRSAEAQKAAREAEVVEKSADAAHEPVVQKPAPKDDVVTVDFRVTCRRSQLQMLGLYMKQNGIRYGRISD